MKMIEQPSLKPNNPRADIIRVFGNSVEFDKPLAPFTSYKTGGAAQYFIQAKTVEDILRAVTGANKLGIPLFFIGGGSNLLVSDNGFNGLVVKVDVRGMKVVDKTVIECGAGEDLMKLVEFAAEHGLTGIEFAAGIWGTVGGAVYGNAGAYGGEIGKVIESVTVVSPNGELKSVNQEYCRFGYRDSYLKTSGDIIISVRIKLLSGNKKEIKKRVEEILADRAGKHPEAMTAGCVFKNIPDPKEQYGKLPAGRLLEQVGAKGLSVGGARVFDRHANIIINTGNATSRDISALIELLKKKVRDKFDIELEEEIIRVGNF